MLSPKTTNDFKKAKKEPKQKIFLLAIFLAELVVVVEVDVVVVVVVVSRRCVNFYFV
jgi:hypothetical protein